MTRLGYLKKLKATFFANLAKIICDLGLLSKHPLFKSNLLWLGTLGATFGQNWATFYSNIWSHKVEGCERPTLNGRLKVTPVNQLILSAA